MGSFFGEEFCHPIRGFYFQKSTGNHPPICFKPSMYITHESISISQPPWPSIMLNIGWWCSVTTADTKGALGSVHMVYALLQYPFCFGLTIEPPSYHHPTLPLLCPPPHTHTLPPPRLLSHICTLPQPLLHTCISLHYPPRPPSYLGIPGPIFPPPCRCLQYRPPLRRMGWVAM